MKARTMKNEPGDWVAVQLSGGERAAKVIEADRDGNLLVRVGGSSYPVKGPLPRVRWQGSAGRRSWSYL